MDLGNRDDAIQRYGYLCKRAARRFVRPGVDRADLEQVAVIGLIKAVDRYDSRQTTPFEAYAWLLILGELMHYVRDGERLLRAPRRIQELERRWIAAERELWTLLGREPSEEDVRRFLGATLMEGRDIHDYRASRHVLSFEVLRSSEHSLSSQSIETLHDRLAVESVLSGLSPLERKIVESIHLDGMTVVEVAKRLGYSRRHLTRLHRSAMQRLRNTSFKTSQ
jgi:RNA polymerase sigma-B factor